MNLNDYIVTRRMFYKINDTDEIANFSPEISESLKQTFLADFEQFGQFINRYDQTFELVIGVTNAKSHESDYKRFCGKENCIVIQNWDNINICSTNPIAFFLDMTDSNVIKILMKYFCDRFSKIIFDWSVAKFFTPEQLSLQYEKLLTDNGIAYVNFEIYGGMMNLHIPTIEFELRNIMVDYNIWTKKIDHSQVTTCIKTPYYEIMLKLFEDAYIVKEKVYGYYSVDVQIIVQLIYYQITSGVYLFSSDIINLVKYRDIVKINKEEQKKHILKMLKANNVSMDVSIVDDIYPIPEHPHKPKNKIDSFFIIN